MASIQKLFVTFPLSRYIEQSDWLFLQILFFSVDDTRHVTRELTKSVQYGGWNLTEYKIVRNSQTNNEFLGIYCNFKAGVH